MPKQMSLNAKMQEKFMQLSCELSPENLCCDGELSHSQVIKKLARLRKEWAVLERRVGRKVSEEEVFIDTPTTKVRWLSRSHS